MSETEIDTPADPVADRPRKRPRLPHRFTVSVWMVLTNLVLLTFVVYVTLSLTERALTAPRWLTERIEAGANMALPQGRLSMGRLAFRVNDAGLPAAQVTNLGVYDARGAELARLNQVSIRLAALALLKGEIRPQHLDITGAQIRLLRRADGELDLSLGGGAGATGSLATILDGLDEVFAQDFLADVADVTASDLTIALEDARSGRIWQITDGGLSVERLGDGLDIAIDFDVFNGTEELAETEISIRTAAAGPEAGFGASFRNAAAADIALQSPALAFLGVVNSTISGSVRSRLGPSGEIASLDAALEIGGGALQPTTATKPVRFDSAKAYLTYDPPTQKITFNEVAVRSETLQLVSRGQAYLRDFDGAWPRTLLGQFQLSQLVVNPGGFLDEAVTMASGAADMRILLDPFAVEMGQISLQLGEDILVGRASLQAAEAGWQGSADLSLDQISAERLLALWPRDVMEPTRIWALQNIPSGSLENLRLAGRFGRDEDLIYELGFGFREAAIRVVPGWPLLTGAEGYAAIQGNMMTFVLEKGGMISALGPAVDFSGTVLQSRDISVRPATGEARISASGPTEAIMSILSLPPVNALARSGIAPDFMRGAASADVSLTWPMVPEPPPGTFRYLARATIEDAVSEALVPGQTVTSPRLELETDNDGIEVTGPFEIGAVSGAGTWRNLYDAENLGKSTLEGSIELSGDTLRQFELALPEGSVSRQGQGAFTLRLEAGTPPELALSSDLAGVELAIPEIGWRKPAGETGKLELTTRFSTPPSVTGLALETNGLSIDRGEIVFDADGAFTQAILPGVRVGRWLNAPVILDSRGPGMTPAVTVSGGTLNLTADAPGGSSSGGGGPISARLNQVRVTDAITLTEVEGDLTTGGGLQGRFTARVNGGARIDGQLEPMRFGTGARIRSSNAGRVLADAGIFASADSGDMVLVLIPQPAPVRYRGRLNITNTNVQRAPVLTELLSALSVVGLLDQMRGAGIVFSDVRAQFDVLPDRVTLARSAAVGPSLGVSLDGVYDLNRSVMNMQGVISPVYFLNAIGQIVSPRRGEGLFGFNFTLTGSADAPVVAVNPLSILTPGFFRDIFRAPSPERGAAAE